jgi:hypothetical protein
MRDKSRDLQNFAKEAEDRDPSASAKLVDLTPFVLEFDLQNSAVSSRALELIAGLANSYLANYMMEKINEQQQYGEELELFKTSLVSHNAPGDQRGLLQVEFQSVAAFSESATETMSIQEMDQLLAAAFDGRLKVDFLDLLKYLPDENVFSGAINVRFDFAPIDLRTPATLTSRPTSVTLSHFNLNYRTANKKGRNPSVFDIFALEEITNMYLRSFVLREFKLSTALIAEFSTTIVEHWQLEGTITVKYESTIDCKLKSPVAIPTKEELDAVRSTAFSYEHDHLNGYVDMLNSLPHTNMFSSTFSVYSEGTVPPSEDASKRLNYILVLVAALYAKLVLVAAYFIRKRRRNQSEESRGELDDFKDEAATEKGQSDHSEGSTGNDIEHPILCEARTSLEISLIHNELGEDPTGSCRRNRSPIQDYDSSEHRDSEPEIEFCDGQSEVSSLTRCTHLEQKVAPRYVWDRQIASPTDSRCFQGANGQRRFVYYKARKSGESKRHHGETGFGDADDTSTPASISRYDDVNFLGHFS